MNVASRISACCISLTRRLRRDESGTIVILAAVMLPVVLAATAVAVDLSSLYVERRQAQGAADLAAIAGAVDLDRAQAAVEATLKANGITKTNMLKVTKGNYTPDAKLAVADRFRAGSTPYNAVQVDLVKPGRLYFAAAFQSGPADLAVRAVAANASLATFSIGSRLLAVRGGVLNALTGSLLGTNVNLSVMDYEALIKADVKLNSFLDALATNLHITGASYTDVLNANMTTGNVLDAAATATGKSGNSSAASALTTLSTQAGSASLKAPLSTLLDLGPLGSASSGQSNLGLDAAVNVMDLVNGAAVLANGTNQAAVDLGAAIPGLLSLKADLTIGERAQNSPWVEVGQPGSSVYTAQTRLRLTAEIGGTGLLAGVKIRLPIGIDLAYAQGTLTAASCTGADPTTARATIAVKPGIVKAWIGETTKSSLADFKGSPVVSQAKILDTGVIAVTGRADISMTNTNETKLDFTYTDIVNGTIKRAETVNYTETLVTSLLKNLDLDVSIAGLGLGLPGGGAVKSLVASTLGTVATPLDQVVSSLLNALGVHLGEADVRLNGLRCGAAVLTR